MRKFTATFRVSTPLFLGGADQNQTELRVPSIKGALRFWWRALNYGRYGGDCQRIYKEEGRLFGAVSRDAGQSSILMRLGSPSPTPNVFPRQQVYPRMGEMPGARYLGYGVMEAFGNRNKGTSAGELLRPCLQAPFDFTLELLCKDGMDASVLNALKALGLLGGLGSKARKGYGSLTLLHLQEEARDIWKRPENLDALREEIRGLAVNAHPGLPEFTAFSKLARIDVVQQGADPVALLNDVGKAMQMYRSYGRSADGRRRMVNGEAAEQNFKDDHEHMLEAGQGRPPQNHPRRVVFGLPHNYYFSSKNLKVEVKPEFQDRRASPLFIHIHEFSPGRYAAILTILPARFLPQGEKVDICRGRFTVEQRVDFSILDELIDGFTGPAGKKTRKKRFPEAEGVWPHAR